MSPIAGPFDCAHAGRMEHGLAATRAFHRPPLSKWLVPLMLLAVLAVFDSLHDFIARRADGQPVSVLTEMAGALLYWGSCFALLPPIILLVEKVGLDFRRRRTLIVMVIAGLAFTYVHTAIYATAAFLPHTGKTYQQRFFLDLEYDFALEYLIFSVFILSAYLMHHAAEEQEKEIRASELETSLVDARLRAIEGQLNPHFFFNTLQSISVLAYAGELDSVVEMLGRLSSLLRASLDRNRPQFIALAKELEFIDSYLAIHRLTFGARLHVENRIDLDAREAAVPAMLLQPLVENSIVHGVSVQPGAAIIRIDAGRAGDRLLIDVADNGPGFQARPGGSTGVGLSATVSRLRLLFGDDWSIDCGASDLGGASVRLRLPFARVVTHS